MSRTLLPSGFFWDDHLQLGEETALLTQRLWPSSPGPGGEMRDSWAPLETSMEDFNRRFPVWGIREIRSRRLVAFAQGGLMREGFCLLAASIDPKARGLGLAQALLNEAKVKASDLGFDSLIGPLESEWTGLALEDEADTSVKPGLQYRLVQ